jgi:hypothetical protein
MRGEAGWIRLVGDEHENLLAKGRKSESPNDQGGQGGFQRVTTLSDS